MNSYFDNVNYKIKCVIASLNTFCPESAGSVEHMTIEQIDSYIEDLKEAKQSLIKGKEFDNQPVKVVNIDDIINDIERKTGRKVIDSSFEGNTFTAHLSGDIEPVNITATISFKSDD